MKLVLIILAVLFQHCCFADETVITIESGIIKGIISPSGKAREWRGIPYANPPIDEKRWELSEAITPWNGTLSTAQDGPGCIQPCMLPTYACPPVQSEDCLVMNVFAPREAAISKPLPVMVFFHGGNFFQGFCGGPLYNGDYIAGSTSTVLVTVNYRLGALGFLSSKDIRGNFGLYDQVLALKWVQKNIKQFGGDPNRVTIFGQSAGSISVAVHLFAEESAGLFHAAIMESNPFAMTLRNQDEYITCEKAFAEKAGCAADDIGCLKSKTADEILSAQQATMKDILVDLKKPIEAFMPFSPVIGEKLVPIQPMEALLSGKIANVPIMLGNTAQEGNLFVFETMEKPMGELGYDILLDLIFTIWKGGEVRKQYPPPPSGDCRLSASDVASDAFFVCANRNVTRSLMDKHKMWFYIFDHPISFAKEGWQNATYCYNISCHGQELVFVYNDHDPELFNFTTKEQALALELVDYWTNFAHTGNPNGVTGYNKRQIAHAKKIGENTSHLLYWNNYDSESKSMRFSTPSFIDTLYKNDICNWWDNFGYNFP